MLRAGCEAQQSQYTTLNRSIVITDKAEAQVYPQIVDSVTQKLRGLLEEQIIATLTGNSAPQPEDILRRIRCIQSGLPQYGAMGEITNLPVVFPVGTSANGVVVGYMIFRGGVGAPDTRPYLDVFRKSGNGWEDVGGIGSAYSGYSFHVQPLSAAIPGQSWFSCGVNKSARRMHRCELPWLPTTAGRLPRSGVRTCPAARLSSGPRETR